MLRDRATSLAAELSGVLAGTFAIKLADNGDVVAIKHYVSYPLTFDKVQQALLLLHDGTETAVIKCEDKQHAVVEVRPCNCCNESSDDDDDTNDEQIVKLDVDLSYYDDDAAVQQCIKMLYGQLQGIRILGDRRKSTDDVAVLIVDGVLHVNPRKMLRALRLLAYFIDISTVAVIGHKRMQLHCNKSKATRKRKRGC